MPIELSSMRSVYILIATGLALPWISIAVFGLLYMLARLMGPCTDTVDEFVATLPYLLRRRLKLVPHENISKFDIIDRIDQLQKRYYKFNTIVLRVTRLFLGFAIYLVLSHDILAYYAESSMAYKIRLNVDFQIELLFLLSITIVLTFVRFALNNQLDWLKGEAEKIRI